MTERNLGPELVPGGVGAFLLAGPRFRMYTWAVYHHKIQQAAAGLRLAIEDLFDSGESSVVQMLSDIAAIARGEGSDDGAER